METIEYRDVIDRTGWGPGPWDDEPDKIQYPDPETGLPCLIKRNRMGGLCGYVGVAEGHPLFGDPEPEVAVHGDVTFTGYCADEDDPARAICHIPGPGEPDHVYWIGYDCGHWNDVLPAVAALEAGLEVYMSEMGATYKDVAYVKAENARLAAQLAAPQTP